MDKKKIEVSVLCAVYNHGKYLRECLDGLVNQKTNFEYEVLVHDDASTDESVDIIREYEKKYPDLIKPLYQSQNQHSRGIKIGAKYQFPRVKGRYVAWCEGDDYWTDMSKLQKQFDIMEKDSELSFCTHNVKCINEDGSENSRCIPEVYMSEGIYIKDKMLDLLINRNMYIFHTSSFFMRYEVYKEIIVNPPQFISVSKTGGSANMMIYAASVGNTYYINKAMSCYRLFSDGSWTQRQRDNVEVKCRHLEDWIISRKALVEYLDTEYSKNIERDILQKEFLIYQLKKNYKKCTEKQYKDILASLSKKEQMYIQLQARCPIIMEIYSRLKALKR